MARTKRFLRRGVTGRVRQNFNWNAISRNSTVIVTAAEWHASGGVFGTDGRYHLGDADVYVTNIGPHGEANEAGGVEFHIHANGPAPVDVVAAITVMEDSEGLVVP